MKAFSFRVISAALRRTAAVPAVLGATVAVVAAASAWFAAEWRRDALIAREHSEVAARLQQVANTLTAVINRRQAMLGGLTAFATIPRDAATLRHEFGLYAAGLHGGDPLIRAIQIFPQQGPLLIHPLAGNEAIAGRTLADLLNDERPTVREDVRRTIERRRSTLSNPYELRQGGLGLVARRAIHAGETLIGVATVILDVNVLLDGVGARALADELQVGIRDADGRQFFGTAAGFDGDSATQRVALLDRQWTLAARPASGWGGRDRAQVALARVGGGVAAVLLGWMAFGLARGRRDFEHLAHSRAVEIGERREDYQRLFEEAEAARQVAETERRRVEEAARRLEEETERRLSESAHSRQVLLSLLEDQKATEGALRESEDRYRSLVEASFEWVWEIDAEGHYTYASPRVWDLLGYRPEEVIGRTPFDLMPPEEAARLRAEFAAIVASRRAFKQLENVNRHRDGRQVVLETSGIPVFAADGSLAGYRGVDRDITARREAEQVLRLRSAALEAAANAVVITDRDGLIELANPAFTALSGWELPEVAGRNPRDFLKSGQHDAAFYRGMWTTIASGRVWRGEVVNRRKDGVARTEEMTITPLHNARGEITHYIAIKQDITEQKEIESRLQQSQRVEAIGTLAGGIAHDLNNILAPILLVGGVLRERLPNPEDRDILELAQSSAQRGADIVRQLLTFSRGQQGQRSELQVRHLIKEMLGIMRETFPREIGIHSQVPADLWPVVADPTQLHQVLLNLGVNARDAMPEGGRLTLSARNLVLAPGDPVLPLGAPAGPYVAVEVQDTGHGIPPEVRQRIFDPFFTTKPVGKGTGLGLSTVLGIVRSHGGFITVDSTPGAGTTFRVFLPCNSEGVTGARAEAPEEARAIAAAEAAPGAGLTILVVDDESSIRETTRRLLEGRGYRVLTATDGAEAATLYQKNRDDVALVLTDLMMPVMSGLALIRVLRSLAPELAIIATSGVSDEDQGRELGLLGVTELLPKPVEVPTLLATIQRLLAARRG